MEVDATQAEVSSVQNNHTTQMLYTIPFDLFLKGQYIVVSANVC
jgi:hypothetical protein